MKNLNFTAQTIAILDQELDKLVKQGSDSEDPKEELDKILKKTFPGGESARILMLSAWLSESEKSSNGEVRNYFFSNPEIKIYLDKNFDNLFNLLIDKNTGKESWASVRYGIPSSLSDYLKNHPKYKGKMENLLDED
jgi:hypothetical protein